MWDLQRLLSVKPMRWPSEPAAKETEFAKQAVDLAGYAAKASKSLALTPAAT